MASKIERIIQQSLRCFTRCNELYPESLPHDIVVLKHLVDDITVKDVKLLKFLLQKSERDFNEIKPKSKLEPVEYLRIYENEDVSIGVFILKQGAKLPIHDHPSMYGILKVLDGVIKMTNYSVVGTDKTTSVENSTFFYQHALQVIKHPETLITGRDACSTLTPTERSIHEVECINGPAAFLDILAPPYEEDCASTPRGCHYFKELENPTNDGFVKLLQISNPIYWADEEE